jgi:hypothetical protein
MNRHIVFAVMASAALAACGQERGITSPPAAFSAAALADRVSCPSSGTPASGSRIAGGVEVDGTCILDGVTVNGGITVDSGGHLQFTSSTVNGGISVLGCGELDVNATNFVGAPTGTTATINGGIVLQASAACTAPAVSDADIWTAEIHGELSVTGNYRRGVTPVICGNAITGDVRVDNLATVAPAKFYIGDPDFLGCSGNTITGALSVSNSSLLEVESNTIGGSVLLSGSTLGLSENKIGGSLQCSNGTVFLPPDHGEPSGNTVHGANSC